MSNGDPRTLLVYSSQRYIIYTCGRCRQINRSILLPAISCVQNQIRFLLLHCASTSLIHLWGVEEQLRTCIINVRTASCGEMLMCKHDQSLMRCQALPCLRPCMRQPIAIVPSLHHFAHSDTEQTVKQDSPSWQETVTTSEALQELC